MKSLTNAIVTTVFREYDDFVRIIARCGNILSHGRSRSCYVFNIDLYCAVSLNSQYDYTESYTYII